MATRELSRPAAAPPRSGEPVNGPAMAAFVAAGAGAFAMGLIVLMNEIGLFSIPALYAPAGGVSGRTTLAIVVWLVGWVVLHARWKEREIDPVRAGGLTFLLVTLGILGTFPPLWTVVAWP